MRNLIEKALERLVNILDRRVSVSELVNVEDLVISNATLDELKSGMNKVYKSVNIDK